MLPNTDQKMGDQLLDLLADAVVQRQKAQTVGAPVGPYVHGPGGQFGVLGLSQGIISTHTQMNGLMGMLPLESSVDTTPYFPYITGFIRSDQQEKDAFCDDPVDAGQLKTCIQTAQFGRKEFKTRQAEVNRIGQRINRGEFMDLTLLNPPLVNQMGGIMRQNFALSNQQSALAGRDMLMRIVEVGVAFQRWLCPTLYTGNPANNSAGGGYAEFPGLDILIGTNKVDAISGDECPSLRSDIKDFNYSLIGDTAAANNIVNVITYMIRILNNKASQHNMDPLQLAIVMREPMFYEITAYWPCEYMSYRCGFSNSNANAGLSTNDFAQVQMRDAMRAGKYLLVDGREIPVIVDDCITEETTADNAAIPIGAFSSDIYVIPMTARGGTLRTIKMQYYDYRAGTLPAARDGRFPFFFWSDGGLYLWGLKAPDNWCVELISKIEPRLILHTPHLAGRITNVAYRPLQHPDDPLPSQPYHVNGGIPDGYPAPSPYSDWKLP